LNWSKSTPPLPIKLRPISLRVPDLRQRAGRAVDLLLEARHNAWTSGSVAADLVHLYSTRDTAADYDNAVRANLEGYTP